MWLWTALVAAVAATMAAAKTIAPLRVWATPEGCVSDPQHDVAAILACLHAFTQPAGFFRSEAAWRRRQPDSVERGALESVASGLLAAAQRVGAPGKNASCETVKAEAQALESTLTLLSRTMRLAAIPEPSGCVAVLYEHALDVRGRSYSRGWLTLAVRFSTVPPKNLYLSAPHPLFDAPTAQQAAHLFAAVGAASLLVSNHHRDVAQGSASTCVPGASASDPTHNADEAFSRAALAMWAARAPQGAAHVQWHAHGSFGSCANDTAFLAAGGPGGTREWYVTAAAAPPSPFSALFARARAVLPPFWHVTHPGTSACRLRATTNVLGRLVNGVPRAGLCRRGLAGSPSGDFVHIEQAQAAREPASWPLWAAVFSE